jgi:predicted DNA-binding transcriptional regulator YafY
MVFFIRSSRKARIDYQTGDGRASERIIWPLALSFLERSRMVIAWCELRSDFRCFRVDRMQSWAEIPERIGRSRMALLSEWRKRENIPE